MNAFANPQIYIPIGSGVIVILLGVIDLLGWWFNLPVLYGGHLTPAMVPFTALAVIILAFALIYSALSRVMTDGNQFRILCYITSGMAILLSMWFGFLYITNTSSDLELLLLGETVRNQGGVFPGRPSPHTIVACSFVGFALLLSVSHGQKVHRWAKGMSLIGFVLPWIALTGYASQQSAFYMLEIAPRTGMSWFTAVCLIVLIFGILALWPLDGFIQLFKQNRAGGVLLRWLIPGVMIAPLLIFWVLVRVNGESDAAMLSSLILIWGVTSLGLAGLLLRHAHMEQQYDIELKRANEELDGFAYAASHELKAPLRAIKHLAKWVMEDATNLGDESRANLGLIGARISRMETLLNELLAYARLEESKYFPEQVDTRDLIQGIVEQINPPAGFRIEIAPALPTLYLVKVPFSMVIRNLISNAIKHHDLKTGTIKISAKEDGRSTTFYVTDDGPGIPEQYQDKVLEMFTTLKSKDQVEGTGIGLALVKKIVDLNQGKLTLENMGERGLQVSFSWPKLMYPGTPIARSKSVVHQGLTKP